MQSIHRITGVDTPNNANNGPGNWGWLFELFGVSAPVIRWNSYIILIIFQFKPKSLNNADNNSVNNSHRTGLKDVDEVQPTSTWKEEFTFERVIPNLTKLTTNSIHDLDDRGGHDVSSHVARARTARHNSTHQHSRIVSKIHIDTHSLN